jgi:hypothetical protein
MLHFLFLKTVTMESKRTAMGEDGYRYQSFAIALLVSPKIGGP